jgi:hypothetical protein
VLGIVVAVVVAGILLASLVALSPMLGRRSQAPGTGRQTAGREIDVYSAALRRFYERDTTFGPSPTFSAIYLYDRATRGAAFPTSGGSSGPPIAGPVLQGIGTALADLPPIDVVDNVGSVTESDGRVTQGGVIVVLGRIAYRDGSAEVPISLYAGNVGGAGATYVLEPASTGWRIVQTSGTSSAA